MSEEMLDAARARARDRPRNVYAAPRDARPHLPVRLHAIDRPDLKDRPWPPVTAGRLVRGRGDRPAIFSVIRDRALLVHHPYESFASSTEAFIEQAADRPAVQTIKMTLYRTGGDSPIIRSLIRAAERGKQVAVLVELKARFDEANNVTWAASSSAPASTSSTAWSG
jgi:polyphosphate kinase